MRTNPCGMALEPTSKQWHSSSDTRGFRILAAESLHHFFSNLLFTMRLLTGIFYLLVVLTRLSVLAHGKLISCLCTTSHCQEQQTSTCNTTSMCFSQYLDRKDGSNPLVKGCITSKTPLLCENRRPAVAKANWPVLVCCNTNMCNQDAIPTPLSSADKTVSPFTDSMNTTPGTSSNEEDVTGAEGMNNAVNATTAVRRQHFFSSIYIVVLVIGICCLVVIGAIAMLVLRRQSHQLYEDEFGTVERNGYLKGTCHASNHHDADTPVRNLPKVESVMFDNKVSLNT